MGGLILPTGGSVYLDANSFIYSILREIVLDSAYDTSS